MNEAGIQTKLILGPSKIKVDQGIDIVRVTTANEMLEAVKENLPVDIAIFAAAVAESAVNLKRESESATAGGDRGKARNPPARHLVSISEGAATTKRAESEDDVGDCVLPDALWGYRHGHG